MKFLELLNGTFINVEEIGAIYHDTSVIHTKNGDTHDFLEIPSGFEFQGKIVEFDLEHLICWHKHAICILCGYIESDLTSAVISIDKVMDESWQIFIKELERNV